MILLLEIEAPLERRLQISPQKRDHRLADFCADIRRRIHILNTDFLTIRNRPGIHLADDLHQANSRLRITGGNRRPDRRGSPVSRKYRTMEVQQAMLRGLAKRLL